MIQNCQKNQDIINSKIKKSSLVDIIHVTFIKRQQSGNNSNVICIFQVKLKWVYRMKYSKYL